MLEFSSSYYSKLFNFNIYYINFLNTKESILFEDTYKIYYDNVMICYSNNYLFS